MNIPLGRKIIKREREDLKVRFSSSSFSFSTMSSSTSISRPHSVHPGSIPAASLVMPVLIRPILSQVREREKGQWSMKRGVHQFSRIIQRDKSNESIKGIILKWRLFSDGEKFTEIKRKGKLDGGGEF